MLKPVLRRMPCVIAILAATALPGAAQETIKVGIVLPLTGPFTSTGKQVLAGAELYLKKYGNQVAGKTIELIVRDDAADAAQTKRLAQELIVRDKVAVIAGFGLTPVAYAVAPLATESEVPMVVMAAATSSVTEKSPFIVRTSFSQASSPYVLARWMVANNVKSVATLVSDFAPGYDSEKAFTTAFESAGGHVVENLRVPLQNPDFSPFLQRARDANPQGIFVFIPAGQASTLFRQFVERGLDKSGIRLFGAGDVTDDDVLNNMGDSVLGTVTAYHYSAYHNSPLNKSYVAEFKQSAGFRPNFFSVGGYDGMHLIKSALEKTKGDTAGPALVAAMKGMAWESPRGPVSIDPETRDIVQNIYIRKVERIDNELWNVEFETFPSVKDPVKAGLVK